MDKRRSITPLALAAMLLVGCGGDPGTPEATTGKGDIGENPGFSWGCSCQCLRNGYPLYQKDANGELSESFVRIFELPRIGLELLGDGKREDVCLELDARIGPDTAEPIRCTGFRPVSHEEYLEWSAAEGVYYNCAWRLGKVVKW